MGTLAAQDRGYECALGAVDERQCDTPMRWETTTSSGDADAYHSGPQHYYSSPAVQRTYRSVFQRWHRNSAAELRRRRKIDVAFALPPRPRQRWGFGAGRGLGARGYQGFSRARQPVLKPCSGTGGSQPRAMLNRVRCTVIRERSRSVWEYLRPVLRPLFPARSAGSRPMRPVTRAVTGPLGNHSYRGDPG